MSVTSIEYDEPKPKTYKSVNVSYNNVKKTKKFDSGDFVKDWYDATKFILTELLDKEPSIMNSSSVDHFFMDGAKFDSMYLGFDDETKTATLTDKHGDGMELFVKKGTKPTWDELRKLVGDEKK